MAVSKNLMAVAREKRKNNNIMIEVSIKWSFINYVKW